MEIPSFLLRGFLMLCRFMQWASAVIVMGIASKLIHDFGARDSGLVIYHEVIAVMSSALFLIGLLSPFLPRLGFFAFPIDLIFSYLWLTSFILATREYTIGDCDTGSPSGGRCAFKRAIQAFAFLATFFTICSLLLEIGNLWVHRRESAGRRSSNIKEARPSGDTAATGTTV